MRHQYVIVGGGLAAASAIEGIRAHDTTGTILLLSRENYTPYHRPPLSKDLWFGKKKADDLPVYDDAFYRHHQVEVLLRREIVELEPETRRVWDDLGTEFEYGHLLLATGGRPRRLSVPGADNESIHYFRSLEDYLMLADAVKHVQHTLVVGGSFIALELAAAMRHAGLEVTLLYPHDYPLQRVLPRDLGNYVADFYRQKEVETISGETVVEFEDQRDLIGARTAAGNTVMTQMVLVGVGIEPQVELAEAAGLEVGNGIEVDEYGRTSNANVWAAGDVAEFPYLALGQRRRIEHWDHALTHGKAVGANMAGANAPYTHIPMFWSDFFELGWEAVGDTDASMDVHVEWKEPFKEGVLFYTRDDVVRGVLLWNVWKKVEWARGLIREGRTLGTKERTEAFAAT